MKNGLLVVGMISLVAGCSSEVRYRAASFLFDGVPRPQGDEAGPEQAEDNAEDAIPVEPLEARASEAATQVVQYVHRPFGDGDCADCHKPESAGRLPDQSTRLCLECHSQVMTNKPVPHVPAIASCLMCHRPHKSNVAALLREPLVPLCLSCHAKEKVEKVHGQIADCGACHNPHESDQRSLLDFR